METLTNFPLNTLLLILLRVTVVALIGRLLLAAMHRAAASTRYLVAVTNRTTGAISKPAGKATRWP